jgi:hypothetical protein
MSRRVLPLALVALLPLACNRGVQPAISGPESPPGWQVRYNACIALARRGSESVKEDRVKDTLLEMLDEQQQLRNFHHTAQGKEVLDAAEAQRTVITALQALGELHRRNPQVDISPFKPAVDRLVASPNLAVRTEARKTQQALGP